MKIPELIPILEILDTELLPLLVNEPIQISLPLVTGHLINLKFIGDLPHSDADLIAEVTIKHKWGIIYTPSTRSLTLTFITQ